MTTHTTLPRPTSVNVMTHPHLLVITPDRVTHNTSDAVVAAAARAGLELTIATYLSAEHFAGARHVRGVIPLVGDDGETARPEEIVTRLRAAFETRSYARVVSFAEDYVEEAAAVNAMLRLGGNTPMTALRCRDKYIMREALAAAGVPVPAYRLVHTFTEFLDAIETIGRPCVSKPSNASASEGVIKLDATTSPETAWAFTTSVPQVAEHGGAVLVEGYVSGPELSVEIIAKNGEAIVVGATAKTTEEEPYFAEIMHVHPAPLSDDERAAVHRVASDTVRALGIVDGGVHLEARLTPTGPVVMECAARLGGDSIPIVVKLATGVDLYECVLRQAAGLAFDATPSRGRVGGIRFFQASATGVLTDVLIDRSRLRHVRGVVGAGVFCDVGDFIARPPVGKTNRLGFALATADSAASVVDALVAAESTFTYTLEPQSPAHAVTVGAAMEVHS